MTIIHGFELKREQEIPELKIKAFLFDHIKTGAELLSLENDDENKVFGVTFRTPPSDSKGLPHILEHSVLCGSRKYPVKEPFVELLKGSLQTFLNAMTYPDKTCYPVASQNVKDFYNLIDVYLDAVFYPRLNPFIFQQEGWHYELEKLEDDLSYKGVVFNEMKGAYSSPDALLSEYSMQSLFPDNTYGFDSGGDPKRIPDLTFKQFKAFHSRYYHPSNARIFFYGDDDPEKRLYITNGYLKEFDRIEIDSHISLQRPFHRPRRIIRSFAAGKEDVSKGMITLNWLFPEATDKALNLTMHILEYILLGMPGSPLRKALIESNLGEDIAGVGLGSEIQQMYFSTGMKGIDLENADKIENLILQTLTRLNKDGIDPLTIEAALNSIEFSLRENNTGSYPRGLSLMLRSLTTWLYDDDPLALIAFESVLEAVKSNLSSNSTLFEQLIERFLLKNQHRTTLILKPDPGLSEKERGEEENRLNRARETMGKTGLQDIIDNTLKLKEIQAIPDPPESLATIPVLNLSELDKTNKFIPLAGLEEGGTEILYHDLFTNGITYIDIGFNLHTLPQRYLPYVRLFGRALLEMGTEREDYVTITQHISRKTGGIRLAFHTSLIKDSKKSTAWLFLRGKAMLDKAPEMLEIIRDVLLMVQLDNRERFRQIVLEAKARQERKLIPRGHQIVNLRLSSHFNEADWAAEQMSGLSYLFFLRKLARAVDEDWQMVLKDLSEIHRILVNRNALFFNVTLDESGWTSFQPELKAFLDALPVYETGVSEWSPGKIPGFEGITIPSNVNYVGKGTDLYRAGYGFHGSAHVITRFLRNSWLWERVRVQGGAYGAFCLFSRLSGTLIFVSYRDPNLLKTLDVFDQSARYLRELELTNDELSKGIIGSIGDLDGHKLPDAKGYTSMVRQLSGETDVDRQKMREEILGTTAADFKAFADLLETVKSEGIVKVLGSQNAIEESIAKKPQWLNVISAI